MLNLSAETSLSPEDVAGRAYEYFVNQEGAARVGHRGKGHGQTADGYAARWLQGADILRPEKIEQAKALGRALSERLRGFAAAT